MESLSSVFPCCTAQYRASFLRGGGVGTGMKLNLLLHCTVQYRASFDEEQGRGSGMKWNHVALQKTGLLFPGGTGGGGRVVEG